MSRYVLSPAARVDLEQIWDYTCERWDDSQAEEYVREIQRAIEWLCQLEVAPGGRLEVAPCDFKLNRELPPRLAANEG